MKKTKEKTMSDDYIGKKVPQNVVFKTRVRDESVSGPNPYRWEDVKSGDLFKRKRSVLFALPGAFTPTCSTYQLPKYEELFSEFQKYGVKSIYCLSVNDAFVMNQWGKAQNVNNVELIPDGSGLFTKKMGMLVKKDNLGFGVRSWRYAMVVKNGKIEAMFEEDGKDHNVEDDPYEYSNPEFVLNWLKKHP
jgi:thioredoxin-dependent peroxiredoxin